MVIIAGGRGPLRGLANRQGERGDLYAIAHIDVPAVNSTEAQALYRALADAALNHAGKANAEHPHSAFAA